MLTSKLLARLLLLVTISCLLGLCVASHEASFRRSLGVKDHSPSAGMRRPSQQQCSSCDCQFTSWIEGPPCPLVNEIEFVDLDVHSKDIAKALSVVELIGNQTIEQLAVLEKLGLSIGVVYNQTTWLSKSWGTVNASTTVKPTEESIYRLGSITKIFTSLLFAKAVQDGAANINTKLSDVYNQKYPPAFTVINPFNNDNGSSISLGMLASHTSGIMREAVGGIYSNLSEAEQLSILAEIPLYFEPATHPHYSNLGVTLLGRAVARLLAKNSSAYEDLIVDELTSMLNMSSTGFNFTNDIIERMVVGYNLAVTPAVPASDNTLSNGWGAPAAGLYSSLGDMIKFLKFLLQSNNGPIDGDQHQQYVNVPGFNNPDGMSSFGQYTWERFFDNGYQTITKGGLTGGFASSLAFVPSLKLGIVALLNGNAGAVTDEITAQALAALVPAVVSELKKNQPVRRLPSNYKSFLGSYCIENTSVVDVTMGTPGYMNVTIQSNRNIMWWQPSLSVSPTFAFRYRNPSLTESCFFRYSDAEEGLLFFQQNDSGVFLTIPDFLLYQLSIC